MKSTIIQYFNKANGHYYRYHRKERRVLETRETPWANIPCTNCK